MVEEPPKPERFSLSRWSRRKHAATRVEAPAAATTPEAPSPQAPLPVAAASPPIAPVAEPLPPVESLTIDSDFAAFFKPEVDDGLKRAALKKLFTDPRFNVMDGLDIYVGDYTQPDPFPAGMLEKLAGVYGVLVDDQDPAAEAPVPARAPPDAAAARDGDGAVATGAGAELPAAAGEAGAPAETDLIPAAAPPTAGATSATTADALPPGGAAAIVRRERSP